MFCSAVEDTWLGKLLLQAGVEPPLPGDGRVGRLRLHGRVLRHRREGRRHARSRTELAGAAETNSGEEKRSDSGAQEEEERRRRIRIRYLRRRGTARREHRVGRLETSCRVMRVCDETDGRKPRCPLRSLFKALSSRVAWRRRTTRKAPSAATGTGGKRRPAPNGKVLGRNGVRGHWNSRKWPHARRFCAWDVASLLARFGLRTLVCVTIFKLLLRARHRQAGRFSLPPSFQTF